MTTKIRSFDKMMCLMLAYVLEDDNAAPPCFTYEEWTQPEAKAWLAHINLKKRKALEPLAERPESLYECYN